MPFSNLSRRSFFSLASSTAAVAALPVSFISKAAAEGEGSGARVLARIDGLNESIEQALKFQNFMMDAYASGSTLRLIQSYSDGGLQSTSFTYDNAVSIHGYLAAGGDDNVQRARILGESLLYAQRTNVPIADGRFAQAYFVNTPARDGSGAYITPAAAPFYFYTSAVGDQAWAGMALAKLYAHTQEQAFLTGALWVANWIVDNAYSTSGAGGFSFGTNINQYNQSVPSGNGKATEHNIDTYAFFTMLHALTDGGSSNNGMYWAALAEHARTFVLAMYNAKGPFFWTGTQPNGVDINYYPVPEDCQTWSYLALLDTNLGKTIDWATANLETTDTASAPHSSLTGSQQVHGLVFDTASLNSGADDQHAVWLEGTSHGIAALIARILHGGVHGRRMVADVMQTMDLLKNCMIAQQQLGGGQKVGGKLIPARSGLVAATSVMDTGFGYTYGPSLHIGATGWYVIANHAANPFRLADSEDEGRFD